MCFPISLQLLLYLFESGHKSPYNLLLGLLTFSVISSILHYVKMFVYFNSNNKIVAFNKWRSLQNSNKETFSPKEAFFNQEES